ncbi:hypothetical protein [Sphingomonas sp.]|uniref:hypothetical protein n=1 Tax=Sphingomonas sp. TaxID=28214 RepID=UPI0038A6024C
MKYRDQAAAGLASIEEAILGLLAERPEGLINNEIARTLKLESDFAGRQKNYLTYSVLGGLLKRGLVKREKQDGKQPFKLAR